MRWMVLPLLLALSAFATSGTVQARVLQVRIQQVESPVATLDAVRVRLDWPAQAPQGQLELRAGRLASDSMGYRWRDVLWRCPLQRDGRGGWRCEGELRSAGQRGTRLALHLRADGLDGELSRGDARIHLARDDAQPALTRIDLTRVPAAWVQALARQGWADVQLQAGRIDGQLRVHAPANAPLRMEGRLQVAGLALQNADASIASENLAARLSLDWLAIPGADRIGIRGELRGGEFLAGNTYLALPATPVALEIDARRQGDGWALPRIAWRDGAVLQAEGSGRIGAHASLRELDMTARSDDMRPLRERYLSGWMGLFGMDKVDLLGRSQMRLRLRDGVLQAVDANLHQVDLVDPDQRFGFSGLDGDVRFSAGEAVASRLRWRGSSLYGLEFGAAQLPFDSVGGVMRLREGADIPIFGGVFRIGALTLRPPSGDTPFSAEFALEVEDVDFGRAASALGLPAFRGTLNGFLPQARYANDRLDFDGGLSMSLFDGTVQFSRLSLERPFSAAPSLGADIDFRGIDLAPLTEVLDVGGITGRLDGRIHDLRLVDWTPVAFDAQLRTVPRKGVRQRISQRAVQDISSVGDASFVTSLQGQLIGLFDDFGYSRIGIGCRLANEVCEMSGLRSDANSFTIVEGAGLPRLSVVGYNRRVNWPTLVERLAAAGRGDMKPVID